MKSIVRKGWDSAPWISSLAWQSLRRGRPRTVRPAHIILAIADHFEPAIDPAHDSHRVSYAEQMRRLDAWCQEYPKAVDPWRDSDGRPLCHTYFYPAEQYDAPLIDRLAEHCHRGWGELEIHLHHGQPHGDTAANTRRVLLEFRDALARRGCLARYDGDATPRYAFVHGNWALANSGSKERCGVDEEMQILAETGCYADMTLPSAPNRAQTAKINAIYECALPLTGRAPHRKGHDLRCGRPPATFPLIVQGPLGLSSRGRFSLPQIESGQLTALCPPTLSRFQRWRRVGITVEGRPEWVFIKLYCHGMDPRDESAMYGPPLQRFLQEVTDAARSGDDFRLHFVTAREMVNIILAACDGKEGSPGNFRDYRLKSNREHPAGRR